MNLVKEAQERAQREHKSPSAACLPSDETCSTSSSASGFSTSTPNKVNILNVEVLKKAKQFQLHSTPITENNSGSDQKVNILQSVIDDVFGDEDY